MGIIDRKRVGPLLLMVSLAVVGSVIMLLMATTTFEETVMAQEDCTPSTGNAILDSLIPNLCDDDDEPTPASTPDDGGNGSSGDCVGDDTPLASLPGATLCSSLTATAEALTATAEANAAATAAAMTATAAALTATAEAQQTATAAEETATAVAQANATAQANADATATARARDDRRTAVAQANETATAEAAATVAAGGVPPPAPKASATPVMTEMAEVTAAEGATTIEPDMSAELMAGNVTVKFPTLSRARTYQAMLSESDDCGDMAMACAMVSIYTAEGEMESDVRLISAAEIMVTLDAETVSAMGGDLDGSAVAIQANALGGIMLQLMDAESGEWNSIPSSFMVNDDGSVTVSGMTRGLGNIALNVYGDVVDQARMQLSMALGTPTATPVPPTPTATPVPPTPTPTPMPVPPPTGDSSVPFLMLLAMAIVASMAALVGAKVITARVRR